MSERKIITVISIIVLAFGLISSAKYLLYKSKVTDGDYRYTAVAVKEKYYKGDVIGKVIEYRINGVTYNEICTSQLCKDSDVGEIFVLKVYLKDPHIFEVINLSLKSLSVPDDGWKNLPKDQIDKP